MIPWQEMLREIHAIGLQWKAIGERLDCAGCTVRDYVYGRTALLVTFERGLWILDMHRRLCPVSFSQHALEIKSYFRSQMGYEAIRQIMESH